MQPLEWRVEKSCSAAWPALRQVRLGDWLLRIALANALPAFSQLGA